MTRPSTHEQGSVMVNTLAILAVAGSLVLILLDAQDDAIIRAQRFTDAGQALEIARGAEDSARSVLARELDDPRPWAELNAAVEEDATSIGPGEFSLRIEDAQSRFNLNNLVQGGLTARGIFERIAASSGFRPADIAAIADFVRAAGPLDSLDTLTVLGLSEERIDALAAQVTALPERTDVNMNTADEAVLAAHLGNAAAARALVMRRNRVGYVDRDMLSALRILPGPGLGYQSSYFSVEIDVTVGESREWRRSLIWRGRHDGAAVTRVIARSALPVAGQ